MKIIVSPVGGGGEGKREEREGRERRKEGSPRTSLLFLLRYEFKPLSLRSQKYQFAITRKRKRREERALSLSLHLCTEAGFFAQDVDSFVMGGTFLKNLRSVLALSL